VDEELKPRLEKVADAVNNAFENDLGVRKVLHKIELAGYDIVIALNVILKISKNPANKKEGEDEKFLRSLKIDPKDFF
jgi:hypothetical protein